MMARGKRRWFEDRQRRHADEMADRAARILGVDMARPGSERTAFVVPDQTMFYIVLVYSGIPISESHGLINLGPGVEVHR